jgi:hypothetical protein
LGIPSCRKTFSPLFIYLRGHQKLVQHFFSLCVPLKQDPSKCWVTIYQTTQHHIPENWS